ncbi:MAG: hypothetical protein MZU97_23580 [Bacillus subtilis]|nr:hypothetical protein [Bacillus subtilis]
MRTPTRRFERIRDYITDELLEMPSDRNRNLMISIGADYVRHRFGSRAQGILSVEELATLFLSFDVVFAPNG